MNELSYGSKVKVETADGQAAHLYNAQGEIQAATKKDGEVLTVLETKKINGKIFYRVGGQQAWLSKADTNCATQTLNTKKEDQKDADKYSVSIKDGLTLERESSVPDLKGIRKIFKKADSFPAGTTYKWIVAPNTNENKYTNAKIEVTFPDGSSKKRTVHYNITQKRTVTNKSNVQAQIQLPTKSFNQAKASIQNLPPKDFDFDFMKQNSVMMPFTESVNESLKLYEQGFYDQMSNTIRKGLEICTDRLLLLNQINPGQGWQNANLSNKLAYIAYLRLLPKRILDLCFSIKNYGNIGSHYTQARVNQVSALADLRQYHDLLVYLVNAYNGENWPYADVQITDEQSKHPVWYRKPQINPIGLATYQEFFNRKNNPQRPIVQQAQVIPTPTSQEEKPKMSQGMKILISCFIAIGVVIVAGIGYEVYQLVNNNSTKTEVVQDKPLTVKEKAAKLTTKQLLALSLIYAKRNDDSKFSSNWQNVYDNLSNNNYNVGRFNSYTFGDATVSAQGQNYIYVFEKGVGLGYQDKGKQKLVSFFDADTDEPVRAYDYQMLQVVNNMSKVKKLAKKLVFTNESEE